VKEWSNKMDEEDWKELLKIVDRIEIKALARIQSKENSPD
jgi:hypothetical protein